MIRPYFILISVVRMSAVLTGTMLHDNYAFHGALRRFLSADLGEPGGSEKVENLPDKAGSFAFGQKCGTVGHRYLSDYDSDKMFSCEAFLANKLFIRPTPGLMEKYSSEEIEKNVVEILRALVKRAQIRTHTAKPGGEDIHAWLAAYYGLYKDYEAGLPALARAVLNPDVNPGFFDENDPITALALMGETPSPEKLASVTGKKSETVFGNILRDIVIAG